jgi:hypothetical protein
MEWKGYDEVLSEGTAKAVGVFALVVAGSLLMGWWLFGLFMIAVSALFVMGSFRHDGEAKEVRSDTDVVASMLREVARQACDLERVLEKLKKKEQRVPVVRRNPLEAVVESSVLPIKREIRATDVPNGVVVSGPNGKPLLVDFDDKGRILNKGTQVSIEGWFESIGIKDSVPEEMLILVHSVKGDDQMLVKSLEVSRLYCGKERLSVKEAMRRRVFKRLAETIRRKYIEKLGGLPCESTADATDGCG